MSKNYGCALLAGGAGKRMGKVNKADMMYGQETIGARICSELKGTGLPCYMSEANYNLKPPPGWTLVHDCFSDHNGSYIGPMGGIFSCLKKAKEDRLDGLFFVPCDAPLFRKDEVEKLGAFIDDDCDAVIWQTRDGRYQTTFAFYSISCLPQMEEEIQKGLYKLRGFVDKVRFRIISAASAGVPEEYFTNINYVKDYQILKDKIEM